MDNQKEYVESLMRIINNELPIIVKYNKHLYQLFFSAIELILDQSYNFNNSQQSPDHLLDSDLRKEVDEIVNSVEKELLYNINKSEEVKDVM